MILLYLPTCSQQLTKQWYQVYQPITIERRDWDRPYTKCSSILYGLGAQKKWFIWFFQSRVIVKGSTIVFRVPRLVDKIKHSIRSVTKLTNLSDIHIFIMIFWRYKANTPLIDGGLWIKYVHFIIAIPCWWVTVLGRFRKWLVMFKKINILLVSTSGRKLNYLL